MKRVVHRPELCADGFDEATEAICRLRRIEEALKQSNAHEPRKGGTSGRNCWTRGLDALLAATRRYAPPLHWLWVVVVTLGFFIYAHLVAWTTRLAVAGERRWPDVSSPCVLAMWRRMRELVASGRGAPQAAIANGDYDRTRSSWRLPGALLPIARVARGERRKRRERMGSVGPTRTRDGARRLRRDHGGWRRPCPRREDWRGGARIGDGGATAAGRRRLSPGHPRATQMGSGANSGPIR
jgi:hypothetical protein